MSILTDFRPVVTAYQTLAMQIYDKLGGNTPDDLLKIVMSYDNRRLRQNPVNLQHIAALPEVARWISGLASSPPPELLRLSVPLEGYGALIPFNEINVGRPDQIVKVEDLVRKLPAAYNHARAELAAGVLETNPLCLDGQSLFDTDHPFPQNRGTFSNIISAAVATPEQALDAVKTLRGRFALNQTLQRKYTTESDGSILIICRSDIAFSAFNKVRSLDKILNDAESKEIQNTEKGRIEVWKTSYGQSDASIFAIDQSTDVRPVVMIDDLDPVLDVENGARIPQGHIAITFRGIMAAAPLFPQGAIQLFDAG